MNTTRSLVLIAVTVTLATAFSFAQSEPEPATDPKPSKPTDAATRIAEHAPATLDEARARARILHETVHGALQVMHRDFFRDDEGLKIPSRSLEDVFSELAEMYGVEMHWIAVDLKAMSLDNEPENDIEKQAAAALKQGQPEFETTTDGTFHFAGPIRLSATCLSCHASRRSSNDPRNAGLVISMPIKPTK